jgi:Arc/MetJ family transcription regulator
MNTRPVIDDALLTEALKEGGLKTKKDTVNAALREYIQKRKQKKILALFGTIDFDRSYDHKPGRDKV